MIYTDSRFIKRKIGFFNICTGISPPADLFVGRSLVIVFIFSVVASLNEKLPLTLYRSLLFWTRGWFLNLQTVINIIQSFADLFIRKFK